MLTTDNGMYTSLSKDRLVVLESLLRTAALVSTIVLTRDIDAAVVRGPDLQATVPKFSVRPVQSIKISMNYTTTT